MNNFNIVSPEIEQYISGLLPEEDQLLQDLVRETNLEHLYPRMLSGHIQGSLLSFLMKLLKPKRVLEIGTYTGYSSICMGRFIGANATIETIEINKELSPIHTKYLKAAGLEKKVNCLYGDAVEILSDLEAGYDFVFLDADKANYPVYYELIVPLMSEEGCLLADNVLWSGRVVSEEEKDKQLKGIKQFNIKAAADERTDSIILSIRDGLNLIRKKA